MSNIRALCALALFASAVVAVWALAGRVELVISLSAEPPLLKSCDIPQPTPSARVVAVAVEQPRILSSVSIGNDDGIVNVLRIHIEEGDQPLFVLAVADRPVIFSVSGAVSRIERLVTAGHVAIRNAPIIGVAGLAAEKVSAIAAADWEVEERVRAEAKRGVIHEHFGSAYCTPSSGWFLAGQKSGKLDNLLPRRLRIDQVAGGIFATDVSLPSARVEGGSMEPIPYPTPSNDFRRQIQAETQQEWPGGVETLDPALVVSMHRVKSQEVLPGGAGILQLLERNVIEPLGEQSVTIIGLDKSADGQGLVIPEKPRLSVITRPRAYRVLKPMRFPAELNGRWDFTFCLPAGMPMPEGRPGASTVILEQNGKVAIDRGNPNGGATRSEVCGKDG
ncbi:MAG: hypothetical protein ABL907_05080 [Hyphomicrobium sp.]